MHYVYTLLIYIYRSEVCLSVWGSISGLISTQSPKNVACTTPYSTVCFHLDSICDK